MGDVLDRVRAEIKRLRDDKDRMQADYTTNLATLNARIDVLVVQRDALIADPAQEAFIEGLVAEDILDITKDR